MTPARKLSLKREALQELSTDELAGVAGGATKWSCHSCMTYVSCYLTDCIGHSLRTCDPSVPGCVG